MENVPDDVLLNILVRIRAKQLGQMRCISKSWNAHLSHSSFIKSHLDRSVQNKDGILLVWPDAYSIDPRLITARHSRSPHLELPNFIKLPVDTQSNNGNNRVFGSVNGLICFVNRPCHNSEIIYIWNPSLSAVLTLPPYFVSSYSNESIIVVNHFRFGFDPKTDDYKVVKLTVAVGIQDIAYTKWLQVEVYSMRKGSWKLISQKIPSHIKGICDQNNICLDGHSGHLHWPGKTHLEWKSIQLVVAFDLCTETFSEISLPDSIQNDNAISNYISVLGGKLCVMSCVDGGKCEVWVMDEYGVAESWVKHLILPSFGGDIYPFGFTSHSEFLFKLYRDDHLALYGPVQVYQSDNLALYDPVAAKTKMFEVRGDYYNTTRKFIEYVDSLVWITPAKEH